MKYLRTALLAILLSIFLIACGDDNDSDPGPTVLQGQFLDSAVQGLNYRTDNQSGTTSSNGLFTFRSNETVNFSVGEIAIGSSLAGYTLTPFDLTSHITNITVARDAAIKIAQFLQSLDDNNDPSDGILIDPAFIDNTIGSGTVIDFTTISDTDLQTIVRDLRGNPSYSLVSVAAAATHLDATANLIPNGSYQGTWTGGTAGNWNISINKMTGTLSGAGTFTNPATGGSFNITGKVTSLGGFKFTTDRFSTTFSGNLSANGTTVSGTWQESGTGGLNGTFTGDKI